MQDKKFAFESDETSVAIMLPLGLGDCVVARKIFNAIVELSPRCIIDVFCRTEAHPTFAKAFFGDSSNLNRIFRRESLNKELIQKYDLALRIEGTTAIFPEAANAERLKALSPALFEALIKIDGYNKQNIYPIASSFLSLALRNINMSRILRKNCVQLLSCNGALPLREDGFDIPLNPEYKSQFDALKLGKYITIYSDIDRDITPPKVKTWPIQYLREYVIRMKKRRPDIEIIQCGGGLDLEIDNVDRDFLGCDLELTKYILANSLLHVGCEGGLVHLATALGTKCLALFGASSVYYSGYKQNINLTSDVCSACVYVWGDGFARACGRGAAEPPCMLSHTPQLVCEVTCSYLKNNT